MCSLSVLSIFSRFSALLFFQKLFEHLDHQIYGIDDSKLQFVEMKMLDKCSNFLVTFLLSLFTKGNIYLEMVDDMIFKLFLVYFEEGFAHRTLLVGRFANVENFFQNLLLNLRCFF